MLFSMIANHILILKPNLLTIYVKVIVFCQNSILTYMWELLQEEKRLTRYQEYQQE